MLLYRELEVGDIVICKGVKAEIGEIIFQDAYMSIDVPGDRWYIDIEFKDTNGKYRHWKSSLDGGRVVYKKPLSDAIFTNKQANWAKKCLDKLVKDGVDTDNNLCVLHKLGEVWRLNIGGRDCGFLDDLVVSTKHLLKDVDAGKRLINSFRPMNPNAEVYKQTKDYEFKGLVNSFLEADKDVKLIVIPSAQMLKTPLSGVLVGVSRENDIQGICRIAGIRRVSSL